MVLRYEIHEWGSTARTRRRSRAVIMELNVRIFAGGGEHKGSCSKATSPFKESFPE